MFAEMHDPEFKESIEALVKEQKEFLDKYLSNHAHPRNKLAQEFFNALSTINMIISADNTDCFKLFCDQYSIDFKAPQSAQPQGKHDKGISVSNEQGNIEQGSGDTNTDDAISTIDEIRKLLEDGAKVKISATEGPQI